MLPWDLTLKAIACAFHAAAIASTVFRLLYRWYTTRFWWEDGWAAIALAADVVCLVSALLEAPITARWIPPVDKTALWMAAMGFPCVLWACRTSILLSLVRVARPTQCLRRVAFAVSGSFLVMWAVLMAQKIQICLTGGCDMIAASVGISQLITDVVSDLVLVLLPIYFLRRTKINHGQRVMIFSAFSASLLITLLTTLNSALLISSPGRDGIIVIAHVKTALSLVVCNALVIVAFAYRICRRGNDVDAPEEALSFTTVDLNMYSTTASNGTGDKLTSAGWHSTLSLSETSRATTPGLEAGEEGGGSGMA